MTGNGWQMAYDGRVCDVMFADGDVEREHGGPTSAFLPPHEGSARDLLASLANGSGATSRSTVASTPARGGSTATR